MPSGSMLLRLPPVVASATVHAAECFTTGASAVSHHAFGNIDKALFRRLLLPASACLGAVLMLAERKIPLARDVAGNTGSPRTSDYELDTTAAHPRIKITNKISNRTSAITAMTLAAKLRAGESGA